MLNEELVPIGVMPQFLWREQRIHELESACCRYISACREIPEEWIVERNEHIKWLAERKRIDESKSV